MPSIDGMIEKMRRSPRNIRFSELAKVCDSLFGEPRMTSGSHIIYRRPWDGDPRINIQNENGMAKAYQVKPVLAAIDRLRAEG